MANDDKYTTELETQSGYVLEITPLPPYYADIIDDLYPFMDYPKRAIELLAGDVYYQDYEMPAEPPDDDDDDFHLYYKYKDAEEYNDKLTGIRARVKRDMLLSLCVDVIDGPEDIEDTAWAEDIEAAVADQNYKVPTDYGQRKLMFLKYVILTNKHDIDTVLRTSMFQEVTIPGIGRALEGFRDIMGQGSSTGDSIEGQGKSTGT
jgi:hypothetical protein